MIVTNTTTYDIYFGPLHLGSGVGTSLTIDDTSATSLYLTSDAVADAVNNAYISNKITVSGQALPFPRPTGDPQLLHGSGSPEGSVYAPPGSSYMRRDNSGAGNALYAKTTGRTFSTGWQSFGVPVTSALSGGPPASPVDGDIWIATNVDGAGTRWEFQYNAGSGSTYKWEFIGGAWQVATAGQQSIGTSTTLTSSGSSVTVARGGDYEVFSEGVFLWDAGTPVGNQIDFGISVNGAALSTAWRSAPKVAGAAVPFALRENATGVGAGQTIAVAAKNNTAVTLANWFDISRIAVQPVRIT